MRSLGLATTEKQLREYVAEASKKDKNFVQFSDFIGYVREAQKVEASQTTGDIATEMAGMKIGILHFFDKLNSKQIRDSPPDSVKVADIKHILSSVGEKMSEEELEDMAREIRKTCKVEDNRVKFDDFVNMLQT